MSIQLLLFLDSPWETARGYLREDLEHLMVAINSLETGGGGSGPDGQVDVGTSDILGRLPFSHLVQAINAGVLVGRQSGVAGDFHEITVGAGLTIVGSELSYAGGGVQVFEQADEPTTANPGDIWIAPV
jgi:hypothetical protein